MDYQVPFREICASDSEILEQDSKSGKRGAVGSFIIAGIFAAVGIIVPIVVFISEGYMEPLFLIIWLAAAALFVFFIARMGIRALKKPDGICETKVINKRIDEGRDTDGDPVVRHYISVEFADGMTGEYFVSASQYKNADIGSKVYLLKVSGSKKKKNLVRIVVPN